jgi:OmpA-OmpF porin, OOP family
MLPESASNIPAVAVLLRHHSTLKVQVQGHVNFGPTHDEARRLSQERAEAVVQALSDLGIASLRLTAVGFGFDRPRWV